MLPRPNSGLEYAIISISISESLNSARSEGNIRAEQQQLDEFGHFSTHSFILPPRKTTDTSRFYDPLQLDPNGDAFRGWQLSLHRSTFSPSPHPHSQNRSHPDCQHPTPPLEWLLNKASSRRFNLFRTSQRRLTGHTDWRR
jgi:hypothetical protein